MSIKQFVPWWAKIGAKLLLSRIPARYRLWQSMNLFMHGAMHHPEYALRVVQGHLSATGWSVLDGRTVLELGPGDGLATAVIARALGAERTILVDAGAFAQTHVAQYETLASYLTEQGLQPPDLRKCRNVNDILQRCGASYLVEGLVSLRTIPDGSVDLIFSQAVLEHIRKHEAGETMHEMRRVLKRDGIASHQIDLKDHLGGALNNLRFDERFWEADWVASSGFYTNRLSLEQFRDLFSEAGFDVQITVVDRFSGLPTPREKMWEPFRSRADKELLVSVFDVLLRPRRELSI